LNLAHYNGKYGELPLGEHKHMMETQTSYEPMAKLLAQGMLEMLIALAEMTGNRGYSGSHLVARGFT
jgi:hypothetical protein